MSATKGENRSAKALSGTIRRQIGTQANRRLLTRLPIFAPQNGPLPEGLASLLDALDGVDEEPIGPGSPAKG